MPADVAINRLTGAGPTPTRVDTDGGSGLTRLSTSDSAAPGTANPIPVPATGQVKRSYWGVLRFETVTAPAGTIDNLRFYVVGSNPWVGASMEVATATAYTQATGTPGDTGAVLNTTNYPTISATPSANNAFNYTSVAPLSIAGSTVTNEEFGDYLVLQMTVLPLASQGNLAPVLMTFAYDET